MFDHCFYILLLLFTTKLLWWTIERLLSIQLGVKIIIYQLKDPPRRRIMKSKRSIARLQRRMLHCHIKFKKGNNHRRSRCLQRQKMKSFLFLCGWSSYAETMPHVHSLLQCLHQPPVSHDLEIMAKQAQWNHLVEKFIETHNPARSYKELQQQVISRVPIEEGIVSKRFKKILISSIGSPHCFSNTAVRSSVIIDSGASVCISPHQSDFVTYNKSNMKIKDLLSSNQVAGEGILRWLIQDTHGTSVVIELMGYHIPYAEVCLLSAQVLLNTIGGKAIQTVQGIDIILDNSFNVNAKFCPQNNLPLIPLSLKNNRKYCFWNNAFGFGAESFQEINTIKTILHQNNVNLSASQKELLLWHQQLSHASVNWVQILMREQKWLPGRADNKNALHSGPFIPTTSHAQVCNTSTLKCAACLFAKASIKLPVNLVPRASPKNHILKQDHLQPGNRILADHYFSPILGPLPHTFGKERNGYTCGSLFVDHASRKIFNFLQYSNTALETIRSTLWLEEIALDKGFKIKRYHSNNGIFASAEFKQHCALQHQNYSFSGVGAKHQNGIAECNIKTVAQWAQGNILHLSTHLHIFDIH
jgi:hypothetical protein